MSVERKFSGGSGGTGSAGFRGPWSPDASYRAGDVVTFTNAVFGATAASTGTEPAADVDSMTGTPGNTAAADGVDYELVTFFQVTEPTRITGLAFHKSTLQTQVPHTLNLWDRDVSTSAPIASATVASEAGAFGGVLVAPLIADLLPGRRYAASVGTGTGTDTGYAVTANVTVPIRSGPVVITGFGYSTVVGSIASVSGSTSNYWVRPVYQAPSASWGLIARTDTAVAGAARSVTVAARPDPLACRPNDGTGFWPDLLNTGHVGTPVDYTGGMTAGGWVPVAVADGTVITGKRFLGKTGIGYGGGDQLVFQDCLFEANMPNDALVQIYCATSVRFVRCTFKPAGVATPPGNGGSVSSANSSPGTPYASSWQYIARMVAGQSVFEYCNVWGGAGIQGTGGPDANHQTRFEGCYIHDCGDNDGSGGSNYHHDGIGPDSSGGSHDTVVRRCTIASRGNTQAIALQGLSTYNRVTVEGCYLSGFGNTLSLGNSGSWLGSNIRVLNNVWSAELPVLYGPYYGGWRTGNGNLWRGNRFQVRGGDAASGWTTASHGGYWWPTDNVAHPVDYAS